MSVHPMPGRIAHVLRNQPNDGTPDIERFLWLCRKALAFDELADTEPAGATEARLVATVAREQARDLLTGLVTGDPDHVRHLIDKTREEAA